MRCVDVVKPGGRRHAAKERAGSAEGAAKTGTNASVIAGIVAASAIRWRGRHGRRGGLLDARAGLQRFRRDRRYRKHQGGER